MNLDYQQILERSYVSQMLLTLVGVAAGIGAKAWIGDLNTWNLSGIVLVFKTNPLILLGGFLLFVIAVCSLLASSWIGIGALTAKWSEIDPGDRVVRIGVLGLLAVCLLLIAYSALQFLFVALVAIVISALIAKLLTSAQRRYAKPNL